MADTIPKYKLVTETNTLSTGWVYLSGSVDHCDGNYTASIHLELSGNSSASCSYPLPVTRKGRFYELVKLPPATKYLFIVGQFPEDFRVAQADIRKIGLVERYLRMWMRVVPTLWRVPFSLRQRVGLRWRSITPAALPHAYQMAGRFRAYYPEMPYQQWIAEFDALSTEDIRLINNEITSWGSGPRFKIYVASLTTTNSEFQAFRNSLETQLYRNFSVIPLLSSDAAMEEKCDEDTWIMVVDSGTRLAPHTLYWLAREIRANPQCQLVYADHDYLDAQGHRHAPAFKPDWSPTLLRSSNYIGSTAVVRSDAASAAGLPAGKVDNSWFHRFYLRLAESLGSEGDILHVPALLWHLGVGHDNKSRTNCAVITEHLKRRNVDAEVIATPRGHCRVRYRLPVVPPKVSIIIPTRDAYHHIHACIRSLLKLSTYPNYEVLILDNQSSDPQVLDLFAEISSDARVTVLPYDRPFNYSAINNYAVEQCDGEIICLLNNDTEVITIDWMEEMVGQLCQPEVGAVGAKLYYSDGRVQHAGDVILPSGGAHHLHSKIERDAPGYADRAILTQELSAVTAACLMTRRSTYLECGGLDENHLPVAFNDVDYCLRINECGMKVVWTPYAELYHHESVSRGKDDSPQKKRRARKELRYFRRRWGNVVKFDPYYNPNLNHSNPDFTLSPSPIVKLPWRKR